jgi:hypothetical protein
MEDAVEKLNTRIFLIICLIYLFANSCKESDDENDDTDYSYMCSCETENSESMPEHEFEVTDEDYSECEKAGVKIRFDHLYYRAGRTKMTVTGYYEKMENSPHYLYSLDSNETVCYMELNSTGDFQMTGKWYDCPSRFVIWIYKHNVEDICIQMPPSPDPVCIISITPLPFPPEDCEPTYD